MASLPCLPEHFMLRGNHYNQISTSCLLLKRGAFLAGWLEDHHYHPTLSVHMRAHTLRRSLTPTASSLPSPLLPSRKDCWTFCSKLSKSPTCLFSPWRFSLLLNLIRVVRKPRAAIPATNWSPPHPVPSRVRSARLSPPFGVAWTDLWMVSRLGLQPPPPPAFAPSPSLH